MDQIARGGSNAGRGSKVAVGAFSCLWFKRKMCSILLLVKNNNKKLFDKWCLGETGYPVVDAGMRELNKTGYMHNRARLITANFMNRMLGLDWRKGEKYYQ